MQFKNFLFNDFSSKMHSLAIWSMSYLEKSNKALKNNKASDPLGMINEIFQNGYIGQDLKNSLLMLFNGIKVNLYHRLMLHPKFGLVNQLIILCQKF